MLVSGARDRSCNADWADSLAPRECAEASGQLVKTVQVDADNGGATVLGGLGDEHADPREHADVMRHRLAGEPEGGHGLALRSWVLAEEPDQVDPDGRSERLHGLLSDHWGDRAEVDETWHLGIVPEPTGAVDLSTRVLPSKWDGLLA